VASILVPQGADPSRRGGRGANTVRSAVTGIVREGIAALRPPAPYYPSAAPPARGLMGRFFDLFAAPLAGAAVGVVPQLVREAREREADRALARERAVQQSASHVETMARLRVEKPTRVEVVASSSPVSSPAAEVELCDEKSCTTGQFSHDAQGRPVVKFADGRVARCRLRRGKLTCPVDGRNMQGRVEH
jgi:hypothetical protein